MKWRIRKNSRGYMAEYGNQISGDILVEYKPGYFMPAFIVSEASQFDTKEQAEKYISQKS